MRIPALAVATVALCLGLAACSSSSKSTSSPTTASPTTAGSTASTPASASGITIKAFAFTGELTVKPGEKVTVTNLDSAAHTLTDKQTHLFDTGNIAGSGGTGTFTAPSTPGSYPIGCTYHARMTGTLVVQG